MIFFMKNMYCKRTAYVTDGKLGARESCQSKGLSSFCPRPKKRLSLPVLSCINDLTS